MKSLPGEGRRPVYAAALAWPTGRKSPLQRPAAFSRALRQAPRKAVRRGQWPLVYSRTRRPSRRQPSSIGPRTSLEGVAWSCPRNPSQFPPGMTSAPHCGARSATPRSTSGSRRSRSGNGMASSSVSRLRRRRRPGSRSGSAASSRRRPGRSSAPPSASPSAPAPQLLEAPLRPRSRRRPSTPATASPSSSSATVTGSRTPAPWPWLNSPDRPTTHSSSTPRPDWERPICCMRSGTTFTRSGWFDRPLHHRRGLHQPFHHGAQHALRRPFQARLPRR